MEGRKEGQNTEGKRQGRGVGERGRERDRWRGMGGEEHTAVKV